MEEWDMHYAIKNSLSKGVNDGTSPVSV